jgi:uncharacterized protein YrrD
MVKGNDVIGLKVITKADGRIISDVTDIVYTPKDNKVHALIIEEGGFFSDAQILLIEDVLSIGKDAVIIESAEQIRKASSVPQPISTIASNSQYLTKSMVVTEEGTQLGKITDIYFEETTGNVEEFEVSEGVMKNVHSGKKRFKVEDIVTIGEDVTIVKVDAEQKFQQQAEEQGVKGALNKTTTSAQEHGPRIMDQVKAKAGELGEKVQQKTDEIKESPQTQKIVADIQQKTQQAKDKADELTTQAKEKAQEKKEEYDNSKTQGSPSTFMGMAGGKSEKHKVETQIVKPGVGSVYQSEEVETKS